MSDAFAALDATAQAELVRRGETTPTELVDAAIARIEALNPVLNAVIWSDFDAARRAAASPALPDGPLRGVPFLLKDIGATQAGLPYWAGSGALRDAGHRSAADTELGARFRRAGLVTIGKTNLPELGSCPTTQTVAFGPANNPWDLTRSPAGSSGGAAAAVAAGLVPVAHANDGGGSTRLPAAWCGLVGLKTSRGRMPQPGAISRLVSELVVSRTVRDTAAVLDATCGHVDADLYHLPPPSRPYGQELGADPGVLRVGLLTEGGEYDVDPQCVLAAERTAAVLASMGHHVEPVSGDVLFGGDGKVNGTLWMASIDGVGGGSVHHGRPAAGRGRPRGLNHAAAEHTAPQRSGVDRRPAAPAAVGDVGVRVAGGLRPVAHADGRMPADAHRRAVAVDGGAVEDRPDLRSHRAVHPPVQRHRPPRHLAPAALDPDGLPVGVQLVAAIGREDLLLRIASRLEEAMPWRERVPPTSALSNATPGSAGTPPGGAGCG
ncbi:MAG: amidase family protein [Acidimicrobiales bacterium]